MLKGDWTERYSHYVYQVQKSDGQNQNQTEDSNRGVQEVSAWNVFSKKREVDLASLFSYEVVTFYLSLLISQD